MEHEKIHFIYPKLFIKRWQQLNLSLLDKGRLERNITYFFNSSPENNNGRRFPGNIIRGTGGAYKLSFSSIASSQGQSGSYRVIYFVVADSQVIFLEMYQKNRQESLSDAKKQEIRKMISLIREVNESDE